MCKNFSSLLYYLYGHRLKSTTNMSLKIFQKSQVNNVYKIWIKYFMYSSIPFISIFMYVVCFFIFYWYVCIVCMYVLYVCIYLDGIYLYVSIFLFCVHLWVCISMYLSEGQASMFCTTIYLSCLSWDNDDFGWIGYIVLYRVITLSIIYSLCISSYYFFTISISWWCLLLCSSLHNILYCNCNTSTT